MKNICPNCGSSSSKLKLKTPKFNLLICNSCRLGHISPMPSQKDLEKYYGEAYFKSEMDNIHGYTAYSQMENVLTIEAKRKIAYMQKFTKGNSLLDVGCGLGVFLKKAKQEGYAVSGNDISEYARNFVKKILKIPFYKGTLADYPLPKNRFDIVCAWDVVEHIPIVKDTFQSILHSLKSGGYLFLTTPDLASFDAQILGRFWYGYKKIPEHLIFFDKDSIRKTLENSGFKVVEIRAWGFERDLGFVADKIRLYFPPLGALLKITTDFLKISDKSIYLPLTDMMVVATKK